MLKRFISICMFMLMAVSVTNAAPLFNIPLKLVQPDGTVLNVYQSGDEFYNWVHDKPYRDIYNWFNAKENYTILKNSKTGYYVYAVKENGVLVPSNSIVGKDDPQAAGIEKGLNVVPDIIEKIRLAKKNYEVEDATPAVNARYNLVLFIRFKDEAEFRADSMAVINDAFNNPTGPSVNHYYNETSNGQLNVSGSIFPVGSTIVSYQDSYSRSYYQKYDADSNPGGYTEQNKSSRENTLLKNALTFIKTRVPDGTPLDGNSDSLIDNVVFIVHGSTDAWNDLLWSHMSVYSGETVTIANRIVSRYNFIMQQQFDWMVLIHELGHTLGMPDLYRYYNNTIVPIGIWDVMAGNQAYMSTYMKWKYLKWITEIPEITTSGTYWLKKSGTLSGNVFKIKSPKSPTEYFLLEYRFRQGLYESNLPGSGLVVYRINGGLRGNSTGPPDEIYIYRQDGTYYYNGNIYQAYFNSSTTRTRINDNTNPASFLSNNTPGGLSISNIGDALGDSIRFDVEITGSFVNDYAVEKAAYTWEDISSTGTTIHNWANGNSVNPDSTQDDGYSNSAIPLGFDFTYYGQNYNSIFVGINGLVSFTHKYLNIGGQDETGAGLFGMFNSAVSWPGNKYFPNSIALAYADLDLNKNDNFGGGRILYKTSGDKFILSWLNVGTFSKVGDTTNTFQLVLNRNDNSITINYKKFGLDATRNDICVGIQKDIVNGLGWVSSGDYADRVPTDNSSVKFSQNIPTAINPGKDIIPLTYRLNQNYPNPFNPATNITYSLPVRSKVLVKVFDSIGREIRTLVDGVQESGNHIVNFTGRQLASGVYLYQIHAYPTGSGQPFTQARKMIILK